MTIFILAVLLLLGFVVAYALWLRPFLKTWPPGQRFLAWVEPIEVLLFKKSETILMGRLLWVGSLLVSLYDGVALFAHNLDLTPLTTRILDLLHIPQDLRGLTVSGFIMAIGLMINNLRSKTTKPLALVEVPDSKITPAQTVAIEKSDAVTADAVQAVKAP